MKPRNLLILLLVVAGLLAFIWFIERDLPSTEEREELAKRVLGVEAEEVVAVVIERDGDSLRLERDPVPAEDGQEEATGSWRLVEPLAARADSFEVESLLETLAGLEKERTLDEFEPQAVGLEAPRARVAVVTGDGELMLLIGSEVPASSTMIVQREGEAVAHVVRDALWQDVARAAGEWRSRDVFALERDEIDRITLGGDGAASVALVKVGEAFWLESPLVDRADGDKVDDLLGDLLALEVEQFLDEPKLSPAEMGLDPPAAVVEAAAAEESQRLELGAAAGEGARYARFGGQLAVVGEGLDEALARAAAEWQAASWTSLDTWQIDRVVVREGGDELVLERDAGDWKRGGEKIPYEVVSDLLYAIDGAAAERLVPAAELALAAAELEITLEGEEESDALALHPAIDGAHPATVEGRPQVLMLPAGTVEDLRLKLADVRAAEAAGEVEEGPEEGLD